VKKTLIFGIILMLNGSFNGTIAQGIQAGIKGSLSSTWLLNSHVSDASSKVQQYLPSYGSSYGVSGAIFFRGFLKIDSFQKTKIRNKM